MVTFDKLKRDFGATFYGPDSIPDGKQQNAEILWPSPCLIHYDS